MSRRLRILLFLVLSGCSTHPMADFCDYFKPGKVGPVTVQGGPYGGVAVPQGAIVPPAPNISVGPPAPFPPGGGVVPAPGPLPPAGDVVPPPAPLPGSRPLGDLPPPLPPPPPIR
jgi:hypothetical protein